MKKLLLFLTIFSFYVVVAMEETSLIEDPNAQDQHGNTRLHNAVIA